MDSSDENVLIEYSAFLEWRRSVAMEDIYSLPSTSEMDWIDGYCSHTALRHSTGEKIQRTTTAATADVQQTSGSEGFGNPRLRFRQNSRHDAESSWYDHQQAHSFAIRNSACATDVMSSYTRGGIRPVPTIVSLPQSKKSFFASLDRFDAKYLQNHAVLSHGLLPRFFPLCMRKSLT